MARYVMPEELNTGTSSMVGDLTQENNNVVNTQNGALDALVNNAVLLPTEEEKRRQELLSLLNAVSVSVYDDIPADINTIRIGGVETFARQGLHFVKAKAKMGKSSMLACITAAYISNRGKWKTLERISEEPQRVLHIDTEQKLYDTQRFKRQVFAMAGVAEEEVADNYRTINLRYECDNESKKSLIEFAIENDKPDVVIIDGIVDLLNNFNDVDDSKALMAWLMSIADMNNIVLFCVLHTNKSAMDHNMRGHLGTMSEQKCDTTTECEKDEQTSIATVKCTSSRHRPFPDWAFTWDDDGNIVDAEEQRLEILKKKAEEGALKREQKTQEQMECRKEKMLEIVNANGGKILRSELTTKLEEAFSVTRKTVSPLISTWITDKVIYENQKMITLTPQTELFSPE